MTRSKQYGKGNRIEGAVRRAHAAMVGWHTRTDILDKARKQADLLEQPRPYMYIGKRPAPVVHFIAMAFRGRVPHCKGHHVIGVDCEYS